MSYSDLPLLNELLKPHICKPRKPYVCECQNIEKIKHTPSRGLENWKTWMERRKKIHLKLAEIVQREPGTLVMDHAEEFRTVMERRIIMERTKLVEHTDAVIPTQEYITVPDKIILEKDVYPEKRSIIIWEEGAYYKSRCKALSFELQVVEPHRPDLRDLYVQGFSFPIEDAPKVEEKEESIKTQLQVEPLKIFTKNLRICLAMNGLVLTPTVQKVFTRKAHVMFDYDITTNKVATEYLSLQNIGNTTIHYTWEPVKKIPLFRDILPVKPNTTYFFFNKNKGVVIPQQTLNLPVWFNVRTPGVYSETWEFRTKPKIVWGPSKILVVFHASAVTGDIDEKMERLREKLDANMRERLINETLSTVLSKVPYTKFRPTIYCYNKREVFEAMSGTYDPTVTFPKYLYNKDIVRELQKFYKDVRRPSDPKNWNYSLHELRLLTNAKQKDNEHIKNLRDQKIAKKLESACPVPPTLEISKTKFPQMGNGDKSEKNRFNGSDKLSQLRNKIRSRQVSLNDELEKIISKLECPNTEKNLEIEKYKKVYLLLCTCFNRIENEIENLKQKICIDKETNYPEILSFGEFYQYEYLLDTFIKPTLTERFMDHKHKPADETLKELPMDECSLRYKTYFKLLDSPKTKSKKSPDKMSKKGGASVKNPVQRTVKQFYDPYAKLDLVSFKDLSRTSEDLKPTPFEEPQNIQVIMEHYKYYIYVIIYHNLEEAIGSIVDMFEMFSFQKTPHAVIKEIEDPNYIKRLIDLKSLIAEENMDQLKAKILVHNYRKKSKLNWKAIETQRELRRVKSCSSLWSILRPYEKPELYEEKPISYPCDIYEDELLETDEIGKEFIHRTTSTPDGALGVVEDFKDVSAQKDYETDEEVDDLEAFIEKVKSETSVHSLIDLKFEKETQKELESHASDENYFYYSLTDSELSDISIDSQQNELDDDLEPLICDCSK